MNVHGEPAAALFCGSRKWHDEDTIADDLAALPPRSVVIEGGATGADRIAREVAKDMGLHVATVDALWKFYGKSGGPRRNRAMLVLRPSVVYAYPLIAVGARSGTLDMIEAARAAGIPVHVRGPHADLIPVAA